MVSYISPKRIVDYEVEFANGSKVKCNGDHLWTYHSDNWRDKNKWETTELNNLMDYEKEDNRGHKQRKYSIPTNSAINLPEKEYSVHPYIIGAFIGDGCCKEKYLTISGIDEDVYNKIASLLGDDIKIKKYTANNFIWHFKNKTGLLKTKDIFSTLDEIYNKKSYEKTIPEEYLQGSIQQRWELIQGLFDTDGNILNAGNRIRVSYSTTSKKLAKQIKYLLQTLGIESSIYVRDKEKQNHAKHDEYKIGVNCDNSVKKMFFSSKRKTKNIDFDAKSFRLYDRTKIINIRKLNSNEISQGHCIMVEDLEHLYCVTKDFIVTHNTTTSKVIVEKYLNIPEESVLALAPTASAAKRLQSQWKETKTIQKGIYHSKRFFDKKEGVFKYNHELKTEEELKQYELLLIDEASMVDYDLFCDLKSFNKKMLFMGDKAQLPPVKKKKIDNTDILFNVMDYSTVELNESLRQNKDSDILKICTNMRNHKKTDIKKYKDVLFLNKHQLNEDFILRADQIIVSTNEWRKEINEYVKKANGNFSKTPDVGEKIIFTENNYDVVSDKGSYVMNSLIGTITEIGNPIIKNINNKNVSVSYATIDTEVGIFKDILIDIRPFLEDVPSDLIEKKDGTFLYEEMCRIDYGWAITSHKSQGQEWDKVLYIQSSSFPRGKEDSWKEAYTACSRAKDKLIIVPDILVKNYMWNRI